MKKRSKSAVLPLFSSKKFKEKSKTSLELFAPHFQDKSSCKEIDGIWHVKDKVCMLVESDGGWSAPVRGAYFQYSVIDYKEEFGEKEWKGLGRYGYHVSGCHVIDSMYGHNMVGMCSPIYEENSDSQFNTWKEANKIAKRSVIGIVKTINAGRADGIGLKLCNIKGKANANDGVMVSDRCETVAKLWAKARREILKEKPLDDY